MIKPIIFEQEQINSSYFISPNRGTITEVNIADIHFGAPGVEPEVEYNILREQFISKLYNIHFDILNINGDIFERRFPSTSNAVMYALMFINECVQLCRDKNATLIIIKGTKSHDDEQLNLFYQFTTDPTVDVRIVETTQVLLVKNSRKLCIPEEYAKGADYYNYFLHDNGIYDSVNLHGVLVGSMYGANQSNLDSKREPTFSINDFVMCVGPIFAGHVHTAGCYSKYMYSCSSPIRYRFGEEDPKGFFIVLHNLDTHEHYAHFEEITSFRYDTISLDVISNPSLSDPDMVKSHIDALHHSGIHHIRIIFNNIPDEVQEVIRTHYKNSDYVVFKDTVDKSIPTINATEEIERKYAKLDFLMDSTISEYDKFVMYINYNKGSEYITVDKLKEILGSIK